TLPWKKFKLHLVASIRILPAQAGEHNCADIVRTGNAKVAFLPHRIERTRRDQILHLGQQALKLLENLAASQGEFEALWRSHQKVIVKHHPAALQRPANRRLAQ